MFGMKKFFAFAILALFMVSCNTPSKVAEKFSVAIAHGKVDEAKKYCTEYREDLGFLLFVGRYE